MHSPTIYKRVFGIISLILLTASQSLVLINQDSRTRTLAAGMHSADLCGIATSAVTGSTEKIRGFARQD